MVLAAAGYRYHCNCLSLHGGLAIQTVLSPHRFVAEHVEVLCFAIRRCSGISQVRSSVSPSEVSLGAYVQEPIQNFASEVSSR